jgi:hypothetical protein
MKSSAFYVYFRDSPSFHRNMMPPSSRLKSKPSKKSAETSSMYSYREVICFSEFGVS